MFEFKMPSKLVKNGDPLPSMPPGLENMNMSNPQAASMSSQPMGNMESLMSNYAQSAMSPDAPPASLYGGIVPEQMQSFGMPQMFAQNAQNNRQMGMSNQSRSSGPAFFTI